jgi:hypothetical protein
MVEAFMTVGESVASETWGKLTPVPQSAAARVRATNHYLLCALAWAIPGAAHLVLGRRKGLVFLVVLPAMFAFGLLLQGRIFPIDLSQPLVALAALADIGAGVPYFVARGLGYGDGNVIAVTYEYGNTFLIVAGLLNTLVVIDAYDIAMGRK